MYEKILESFIHFFRRLLFFITSITTSLVCMVIFLVTYEPNTWKKVTMRKIRRIRRLTKFKLWVWEHFGWYFRFIHKEKYLENLEKRIGKRNGL